MICRFCNHEISESSKGCPFCGKNQEEHMGAPPATTDSLLPKRQMTSVKFVIPLLGVILLFVAVLFIQRGISSRAMSKENVSPNLDITEKYNLEGLFGRYSNESNDMLLLTVGPGKNNKVKIKLEDHTEIIFDTLIDSPISNKFSFVADSLSSNIAASTIPITIAYSTLTDDIFLEPVARVIGGVYRRVKDKTLKVENGSSGEQNQKIVKIEDLNGTRWENYDSEGNYIVITISSDDGINYCGVMTVRLATGFMTGCAAALNVNGDHITLAYYDEQWGMTWDVVLSIEGSQMHISADLQSEIGIALEINNEEMSRLIGDPDIYSNSPNPIDTLTDEQLFKYRIKLEHNTQHFSLDELIRSPYNFNSYYRFSGEIIHINQSYDSGGTHGILKLRKDGTSITFDYSGWMGCKVGDEIVLYGTVCGAGKYTLTNKYGTVRTIQTANINGMFFFRKDSYEKRSYLTDYEAKFIFGTYFTTDSPREMEQQLTITPNTINGRDYTITSVQYTFKYDTYDYSDAGECIYVAVKTTNEYGDEVIASFSFDLDGSMFYVAKKGTYTSIYNFDTGSYTRT